MGFEAAHAQNLSNAPLKPKPRAAIAAVPHVRAAQNPIEDTIAPQGTLLYDQAQPNMADETAPPMRTPTAISQFRTGVKSHMCQIL